MTSVHQLLHSRLMQLVSHHALLDSFLMVLFANYQLKTVPLGNFTTLQAIHVLHAAPHAYNANTRALIVSLVQQVKP